MRTTKTVTRRVESRFTFEELAGILDKTVCASGEALPGSPRLYIRINGDIMIPTEAITFVQEHIEFGKDIA